jgi:hypothetical protein
MLLGYLFVFTCMQFYPNVLYIYIYICTMWEIFIVAYISEHDVWSCQHMHAAADNVQLPSFFYCYYVFSMR